MATPAKKGPLDIPYDLKSGYEFHKQKWELEDIVEVAVSLSDGTDEPSFTWIVKLKDKRWLAVRGWHDYTGWDCQSGLTTEFYKTKAEALRTLVDWERAALEKQDDKV